MFVTSDTFRENRDFVFTIIAQFMMSANSRIRFGLQIVFVCLYITTSHYHHCAKLIWRHWIYKMYVRYILSNVWVRLSMFSQLSIIQYMRLCVFSLAISLVMIERIYRLYYNHHQIGHTNGIHCLELGHEAMVCTVCLSILFWYFLWFLYARLKNGRIMLWQCPSVCPSVRPSEFSGLFFNMLWDINLKLGICIQ